MLRIRSQSWCQTWRRDREGEREEWSAWSWTFTQQLSPHRTVHPAGYLAIAPYTLPGTHHRTIALCTLPCHSCSFAIRNFLRDHQKTPVPRSPHLDRAYTSIGPTPRSGLHLDRASADIIMMINAAMTTDPPPRQTSPRPAHVVAVRPRQTPRRGERRGGCWHGVLCPKGAWESEWFVRCGRGRGTGD
jgi:hypothetical protein